MARVLSAGVLASLCASVHAAELKTEEVDFFEKNIRPVLVESCHKCHSATSEKVKGGLLVDTKEGLLKGGDTGPSVVPGDLEKSLLIKAIRHTSDDLQMPPKTKLPPEVIANFEAWVKMGAPDPRTGAAAKLAESKAEKAAKHWAFQPVKAPVPPTVKNKSWVQSPIDAFVLARLEQEGMKPARKADARTLIRRAYYDLTGLPPTHDEVVAFERDKSPDAFARLVDRLLDSPRYGERWGRYWLDVARYADTKGYVFQEERRYPYSYTYRDYVIRAFNDDLPYDRFLIEQLAADQLPLGEDKRPLAAMGYLTLGRRFLNNQADIIDDRIDVMGRGLMGLTIACARCHDHKFDPIPTKDYYSLYGVFANSHEPAEKPLLGDKSLPPKYDEYIKERDKRIQERVDFLKKKEEETLTRIRKDAGAYLLAAHDFAALPDQGKAENMAKERKLEFPVVKKWADALTRWQKSSNAVLAPWIAFAALADTNFTAQAPALFEKLKADAPKANPLLASLFTNPPPESLKAFSERYSALFTNVDSQWREALKAEKPPAALADASAEAVRQVLYAADGPLNLNSGELQSFFDVPGGEKSRALQRAIEELEATHPGAPPRAMALRDNDSFSDQRVFVRGNQGNQGDVVPRRFLQVVAGKDRKPFANGSGRMEMAKSIASPENPLTARVFVNRVWLHHFGGALVRTPADFGLRSDPPTHPELLDYLASQFIEKGWSVKALHRAIMLSATYQQSADNSPAYAEKDPSNLLLWKMSRYRLDLESMRDSLLLAAGKLDLAMGGLPVEITTTPFSTRRTIYGFIERQNLPGMFRTFDFASPDTSTPQRFFTTVPQQALFMLNSPFVSEQALALAARIESEAGPDLQTKVEKLYQTLYQRSPSKSELAAAKKFLNAQANLPRIDNTPAWSRGFGALDAAHATTTFTPFQHFSNDTYHAGEKFPDDQFAYVSWNAGGGHPGRDQQHAAILRWTAPVSGLVQVRGSVGHDATAGDGVTAAIVSNRNGILWQETVFHTKKDANIENIQVKAGDHLDFLAHCNQSDNSDTFSWAPRIELKPSNISENPLADTAFSAKSDFERPKPPAAPLTPFARYAQALLMSNEFAFVD